MEEILAGELTEQLRIGISAFMAYVNLPYTVGLIIIVRVFNSYTEHESKAKTMNVFRKIPRIARLLILAAIVASVFIFLLDFNTNAHYAGMFFGTLVALWVVDYLKKRKLKKDEIRN